jgi:hypothetical protein
MKMRKVLVIALGVASLGAVGAGQSAFAGWTKKQVCEWRLSGAYVGNFETGPLGIGVKVCREIDVLVPSDLKHGSGLNKTFNPPTKNKNR